MRPARAAPLPRRRGRAHPGSAPTTRRSATRPQHAGEQTAEGETADDPERTGFRRIEPDDPDVARTGEAEGEQRIRTGTPPDRDRDG